MECGDCTFCCTMSVVPELNKEAGKKCTFCDNGCEIYEDRPKSCKDFRCAWLQHNGQFSSDEIKGQYLELRPDKCGIMFFKKSDTIFCGAVMEGKEITDKGKQQIEELKKQGYSTVMIKVGSRPYIIPIEGRNKVNVLQEYIGILRNGNV